MKPYFLGNASGFLWSHGPEIFLITSLHVVTGKNYLTDKFLSKNGSIPRALLLESGDLAAENPERRIPYCNLYKDDGTPAWYEHPKLGRDVDVAAIRVGNTDGLRLRPINTLAQEMSMRAVVSQDCFVLGFPLGRTPFPIWKRATIASDPELLQIPGINRIYVDTATRSGMSGSPVILHSRHGYVSDDGTWRDGRSFGLIGCSKLLGIYSSREPPDATGLQLGVVFPTTIIEELVASIPNKQP